MSPNLTILRSALAAMLTDTATIRRATGGYVFDEENGYDERETIEVYSGPVLVRPEAAVEVTIGALTYVQGKFDVTLAAETNVRVGDEITVTASTGDTTLIGRTLHLTDVPADSYQVARFCKAEQQA